MSKSKKIKARKKTVAKTAKPKKPVRAEPDDPVLDLGGLEASFAALCAFRRRTAHDRSISDDEWQVLAWLLDEISDLDLGQDVSEAEEALESLRPFDPAVSGVRPLQSRASRRAMRRAA
jgi:hypothetical protein